MKYLIYLYNYCLDMSNPLSVINIIKKWIFTRSSYYSKIIITGHFNHLMKTEKNTSCELIFIK